MVDPLAVSSDAARYRDYIRGSRGEFSVAKELNVRLATGWFSDRSACYLAAGRPVVVQDTGFRTTLPTGAGLLAFRTRGGSGRGRAQRGRRLGVCTAPPRGASRNSTSPRKWVLADLLDRAGV